MSKPIRTTAKPTAKRETSGNFLCLLVKENGLVYYKNGNIKHYTK